MQDKAGCYANIPLLVIRQEECYAGIQVVDATVQVRTGV